MANIPIYGKLVNETTEQIIADASQIGMTGGGNAESAINNAKPFYADYGVTTSAEIDAAYLAGRPCYCRYTIPGTDFELYVPLLGRQDSTYHNFGLVDAQTPETEETPYLYVIACDGDEWSLDATMSCAIQKQLTFDNAPTLNSDNPVRSGGVYTALSNKQDSLTFDNAPTKNSNNPVKSGGIYTALASKQNALTFDDVPTDGSNNPVKSGGIYSAISARRDVFVATYGTTTNAEIAAACDAGKLCIVMYNRFLYVLAYYEANNGVHTRDVFTCPYSYYLGRAYVDSGGWHRDTTRYQSIIKNVQITLAANAWSNGAQTVTVTGIVNYEEGQLIQPVPASASRAAYEAAGVKATAQATNSLTFSCDTTPSSDLTVYVIITEVIVQ